MNVDALYIEHRRLLFSIAYRMLGTVTDAEDIIQDVFLQTTEKTYSHVEDMKAYLCKMVTNRCLDFLKSAQKKWEVYTGPWLPEPLPIKENDPIENYLKGEQMSYAVLLLFEQLNPIERAVFILREVLEYDYSIIAQMVDRKEATCRKIFSRVIKKLPQIRKVDAVSIADKQEIIFTFLSAIQEGRVQKLEELLTHDVTLYSDGGGKVYAALKPIHSKTLVLKFLLHLLKENPHGSYSVQIMNLNGQMGVLFIDEHNIKSVITFEVKGSQISDIYIVRNPEKLKHIQ